MRARLGPVVLTAVAFAAIGPRLVGHHDKAAGTPFVYQPPSGFAPKADGAASGTMEPIDMTGKTAPKPKLVRPEGEREWTHPPATPTSFVPTVTLNHSATRGLVEDSDLAKIEAGFPEMFANEGITWKPIRRETRTRADGARVGLIEGDCTKTKAEIVPGFAGTLHYRRLIFVFPDDMGSSIVTALYGIDEVGKWQPAFESTIDEAHGVATRVPPPPGWMYAACGAAGLLLGWLVFSFVASRRPSEPPPTKEST